MAFSGSADFSGMTGTQELAVSDVLHEAVVKTDEAGTEAAAATAVVVGRHLGALATSPSTGPSSS